ncbi:uncharacterized protein LOC116805003 [Drosophila grimshawi]|uniref:uncharacterized protein LOC116805003 n=1 Tax=Drosophila grimshawi TaxID=7222 RepID=UPI000C86F5BB|nr:uncharacterized protein LOC116805003 [Drosophila grimshawi]
MKSLGFALLGLLCCTVLAWAEDTAIQDPPIPPQNETEALPIINLFSYATTGTTPPLYGLSLYKMNWFQAEQYCAANQYTLASIPSSTEQAAIMAFIQTEVKDITELSSLFTEPMWTSGTNQGAGSYYMWQGTGTRVGYNNFQSTPRANTNHCLTLNGMTGQWSTDNCRTERYFLCIKKCT